MKENLIWKVEGSDKKYTCRIFDVEEMTCRSPDGKIGVFSSLNCPDFVQIIPVLETERGREFVLVWQWRHGAKELSLEFPGGFIEKGEAAAAAAARETLEETGYKPGKITCLGEFNPNPAIMSNKFHVFLAEDLQFTGSQSLDDDEYVDVEIIPEEEVIRGMGKAPFIHALMATSLALYREKSGVYGS